MNPLRIIAMDHIVLAVSDVERSLAFYTQVLGLPGERVEEWRAGQVGFPSLRLNADTLIDLQVRKPDGKPVGVNIDHFCMVLESVDWDALLPYLRERDVPIVTEPVSRWGAHGRATSIYLLDPDGNQVELRAY